MGGFLAAALARAGDSVIVVAREATAEHIAGNGIQVESVRLGEFTAWPTAAASLQTATDVLFVATKATGLQAALDRIHSEPELVVPLLNGLDHMELLRTRFGAGRVAAGTIRIEAHRPAAGRVVQTSPTLRVDLASDDPQIGAKLPGVAAALERAGVPVEIGGSEAQILWSKLVRLNALACTTSASDRPLGFVRGDPQWRRALEDCISEATAVANADGAEIDPGARLGELDAAHAELDSSMHRDLGLESRPSSTRSPARCCARPGATGSSARRSRA